MIDIVPLRTTGNFFIDVNLPILKVIWEGKIPIIFKNILIGKKKEEEEENNKLKKNHTILFKTLKKNSIKLQ